MKNLDRVDVAILDLLQHNCNLSYDEISNLVSLSPTSCLRRIKKLEAQKYVVSRRAILNETQFGFQVTAIISVELAQDIIDLSSKLAKVCDKRPEIQQCYVTSSISDFLIIAKFRDVGEFTSFLDHFIEIFHPLSVREYESRIVVNTVRDSRILPIV